MLCIRVDFSSLGVALRYQLLECRTCADRGLLRPCLVNCGIQCIDDIWVRFESFVSRSEQANVLNTMSKVCMNYCFASLIHNLACHRSSQVRNDQDEQGKIEVPRRTGDVDQSTHGMDAWDLVRVLQSMSAMIR
jgi:hypothetical protein